MSTTYRAVAWNPQKRRYDIVAAGLILAFLVVFLVVQATLRPELTIETLLIRALAAAAFTLLNIILCIGPLARLNRRFLPLLYNRRQPPRTSKANRLFGPEPHLPARRSRTAPCEPFTSSLLCDTSLDQG